MKRCFKCGETKPLSEFYPHPRMADGHLNKCRECARRDVRENRASRREYYREYERERFQRPERRAAQARVQQRHRLMNPEKTRARNMVHRAILTGRLDRQSCRDCGTPSAEAHHPDYSEPLNVTWLCRTCHHAEHQRLKATTT